MAKLWRINIRINDKIGVIISKLKNKNKNLKILNQLTMICSVYLKIENCK
jgi:hypothetical protein